MKNLIGFLKRTIATWLPAFICTLIVCATLANADPWAPYGYAITGAATVQTGCTDIGAGLNVISNTLLCLSPTIAEPETFSSLLTTAAITSSGTHTLSGSTPLNFTADTGGTGFTVSAALPGTITTSIPELSLINHNTTAGTFGCPDTGTGSLNLMLQIGNSANLVHDFEINCKGNVNANGASFSVSQLNVASSVTLTSLANGQSEVNTAGAPLITGALGTGSVVLGLGGIVGTDVNCGTTAISTSGKAATMTNGVSCLFNIIAADVAGPFTITYIHPFNSKPQCQVTMAVNSVPVNVRSCLAGLSSAVVTLSATAGTNDQFQVTITGGK